MKGETDVVIHNVCLKKGSFIYVINEYGKFLKKITYITPYVFEWSFGWGNIQQLERNKDTKSKVKLIFKS
jgi:hypothetical protein